jgi:phospholipid/cholesterol/gamma-HCH transport system ATP-binding protein
MTTILAAKDVSIGYDKPVLEHITFDVKRGEIVTLLGGSGSGKSTMLRVLAGLLPPLGGEVCLFGESLYELPPEARAPLLQRIGFAFQQDALFSSMTIEDNVGLPLRELTKLPDSIVCEMVRMRLAIVGLEGLGRRMPSQLSGGQRKRAALARASILDPELIFADEPTAGLDPVVAAGIDETLVQFRDVLGITVLVVSHELESIRATADRAVMFANKTIVASGSLDELEHSQNKSVFQFFHARDA